MRRKSLWILVAIILFAPFMLSAVSVAAGHILLCELPYPFFKVRFDRIVVFTNAFLGTVIAGTAAFNLPFRQPLRTIGSLLISLAFLPAYSIAYHSSFKVAQWLGLSWCSSS